MLQLKSVVKHTKAVTPNTSGLLALHCCVLGRAVFLPLFFFFFCRYFNSVAMIFFVFISYYVLSLQEVNWSYVAFIFAESGGLCFLVYYCGMKLAHSFVHFRDEVSLPFYTSLSFLSFFTVIQYLSTTHFLPLIHSLSFKYHSVPFLNSCFIFSLFIISPFRRQPFSSTLSTFLHPLASPSSNTMLTLSRSTSLRRSKQQ